MRHRCRGFTFVELLVAVAIIAIIAAIALVSYLSALNRARQKQTMADIRTIAAAWEARATDTRSYVVTGYSFPTTQIAFPALRVALTPTYVRELPQNDGWGNALQFAIESNPPRYSIRSAGRDGTIDESTAPGATNNFDCDIVYANGSFVCYPETAQH